MRCVCMSMKPGSSVTSPRSITFAFAGMFTDPARPAGAMRLSSMTTTAFVIAGAPVPSIRRAALRTTTPFPLGDSGVIRGVCETAGVNIKMISVSSGSNFWFFILARGILHLSCFVAKPALRSRPMETTRRQFNYALLLSLCSLSLRDSKAQTQLRVNGDRIMSHINALAEFGKNPQGGVSRVAYSDADKQGREYVLGLLRDAKLDASIDAAGNLIGKRAGTATGLKPLLIGSHVDTVPEGGNYDGVVGSTGAIEVAQTLAEKNVSLRHPLEVVIFQNEEGGLIGSRAMDGELTERELDLVSRSGKTIRDGIRFIGGDPTKLAEVRRKKGDIAAYLELHIEQGAHLDNEIGRAHV